jgi:hypothetical protein
VAGQDPERLDTAFILAKTQITTDNHTDAIFKPGRDREPPLSGNRF